jgi:hypothetical protein
MPISARYPSGRSQHFTLSRRNFLQKLAAVVLPSITSHSQPDTLAFRRCSPKFSIGDRIRTSWESETGVSRSENGEVVGICWHPTKHQWEYLIVWDGIFDEYLTEADDLERSYA